MCCRDSCYGNRYFSHFVVSEIKNINFTQFIVRNHGVSVSNKDQLRLSPPMHRVAYINGRLNIRQKYRRSTAGITNQLTELSKEYFLVQIRDLKERLARYQKKCDELEVRNNGFKSQYEQQVNDKKEIVSFLKKQLEQRGEELADLQDRLIGRTEEFIFVLYILSF